MTTGEARRYLTDEEKAAEVERWLEERTHPSNQPPPERVGQGGYGYPDPDIFALTDALNALPGVLTDQSCAGHRCLAEDMTGEAEWNGILWLRLSEEMMERFTIRAYELFTSDAIERCTRVFHRDTGDIAEIVFQGNNKGRLEESSKTILDFFTRLASDGES